MKNLKEVGKAAQAGYKKGHEIARKDSETGQTTSLGKTMVQGAVAGLKASGPGILKNLIRALTR